MAMFKVLLIGGSTGTMLEALQVVGDSNRYRQLYEVITSFAVCNNNKTLLFFFESSSALYLNANWY